MRYLIRSWRNQGRKCLTTERSGLRKRFVCNLNVECEHIYFKRIIAYGRGKILQTLTYICWAIFGKTGCLVLIPVCSGHL